MATIRPSELPAASSVSSSDSLVVDRGSAVEKATPAQVVDAAIPLATQEEAEEGSDNTKRVTPLRVKQAMDANMATTDALASTAPGKGASLSGLEQGGTVQDGIRYLTPEMFGAVGDGATDDTDAFNDAMTALSSTGGRILCAAKDYLINNNGEAMTTWTAVLDLPAGVVLQGQGKGKTRLVCTSAALGSAVTGTRFIRMQDDSSEVRDLTVVGPYVSDAGTTPLVGIATYGGSYCKVVNVDGEGFYSQQLLIQADLDNLVASSYNHVESCRFVGGTGSTTIIYSAPPAPKNVGNKFINVEGIGDAANYPSQFFGVEVRHSDANKFVNCDFTGHTLSTAAGINIEQCSNNNVFVNCTATGNRYGLLLYGPMGKPERNRFVNCSFSDNTTGGVLNNNGDYAEFVNCDISRNAGRGYFESDTTANNTALYLTAGDDTGWVVDAAITSSPGGGSSTVVGYDEDENVLYVALGTNFTVGDTVTSGANSGTIVRTSRGSPLGVSFTACTINENTSYGGNVISGRIMASGCTLDGNVDRGFSLGTSCTGVITGNYMRATFSSAVTQCGDIFASGACKVNVNDNDLTLSKVHDVQAVAMGRFVSAMEAPHAAGTTGMVKTTTADADALTRSGLTRPGLAASDTYCDIPLTSFVGYPSTNVVFRFRVKDDGSARTLNWRSDPSGGGFTDVATSGSGEWEWITVSLTSANIESDWVLRLQKKTSDTATVLLDGYMIVEG